MEEAQQDKIPQTGAIRIVLMWRKDNEIDVDTFVKNAEY